MISTNTLTQHMKELRTKCECHIKETRKSADTKPASHPVVLEYNVAKMMTACDKNNKRI